MTGVSHVANMRMARAFPWKDYRTFADVGTAQGDLAAQIALANPHLRGVGFDLTEVGPIFEEYRRGRRRGPAHVHGRRLLHAGPAEGRCHDPDGPYPARLGPAHEEDARAQGVRRGSSRRAFVVYEAIIDDDRSKNAFGLMMSLNMLIETPAGFDYTGADCQAWMKEAGFSATRVEPLAELARW